MGPARRIETVVGRKQRYCRHVAADPIEVARVATLRELRAVGQMLHDFNREFNEPTPSPATLTKRLRALIEAGGSVVLVAGEGPDGLALLRLRPALWTSGLECYLAELYVAPQHRRQGLGRALMHAAMHEAKAMGAVFMDIGVDETDTGARRLYESLGFTNRVNGRDGPVMYVYERDL